MKKMKIFEPAMCCPTGLCGVSVDPELLRISTVLNTLDQNGIKVHRYNLTSSPRAFVENRAVCEFLNQFGPDKLPVILVDDVIVLAGCYPTNEEITYWLDLNPELLGVQPACCCGKETETCCETVEEKPAKGSCCCSGNSCC